MTYLWAVVFLAVLLWSGINPKDTFTWFLEVLPAVIGAVVLLLSRRAFPLTPMLYFLILLHCIVLMVGGHYTYAEMPLFDSLKEVFGWQRNNYDKLGHLFQGFVPAMIAREILIRRQVVKKSSGWRNVFVVSVTLAISAFYELIEWWVALASGQSAEQFLGTQNYAWDTQSDMAWALVGAILALLALSRWHDRQLSRLSEEAADGHAE